MSVLHELDVSSIAKSANEAFIREMVSKLFWTWYFSNQDKKLTTVSWWIVKKTIYVRDIRGVFEILFGPANAQTA
jgi:hypothetical protein